MGVTAGIGSAIGGIASGVGSILGSGAQSSAANSGAMMQMAAMANQQAQYQQTRADFAPYRDAGSTAINQQLQMAQGGFNFNPTMTQLEATPGYQFNLSQGLNSVQSGAAARGLGNSGAALKGAADYASGLASNTYQQQFGNALTQYQTNIGNLGTISQLGENAAAGTGQAGIAAANGITSGANGYANSLMNAGNAQAAGIMGAANGFGNAFSNYMLGNAFSNSSGGGMGGAGPFTGGSLTGV